MRQRDLLKPPNSNVGLSSTFSLITFMSHVGVMCTTLRWSKLGPN